MDLRQGLEWMLAGAFLACGLREAIVHARVGELRALLRPCALCAVACGLALITSRLPLAWAAGALLALGILASWWTPVRPRRGRGPRARAVIATLVMVFFTWQLVRVVAVAGAEVRTLRTFLLALCVVALGLDAWSLARTSTRGAGGRGSRLVQSLQTAAMSAAVIASLQGTPVGRTWLAAGLLALLGAMLLARRGTAFHAATTPAPASCGELSHNSRLAVVGELTASIAHEINQPLSAILSNVDAADMLLESRKPSMDELRKILRDVRRDGLRASDVIRSVRTLAQKREPHLVKLDLNLVVASVVELLDNEMRRRNLRIIVMPFREPAHVRGDQTLLVQVMINLVTNAMDALEAARHRRNVMPPIEIRVEASKYDEIHVQVIDQGSGIPAAQLDQLFNSFYTSKPHGMGLGLSISRSIIVAHGGRILATNNAGPGVTFNIFLPPYSEA